MDAAPIEGALSDSLSARDREILAFERQWWKYAGAKEQAVRELFDMSATRYYQVLNALIDSPAALAADPMLVKRLRRLRATRQRARSARRLGVELRPTPSGGHRATPPAQTARPGPTRGGRPAAGVRAGRASP
jgi:hypothetical protein